MPGLVQSLRTEWERTAFSVAWVALAMALIAWGWWLLQEDRPVLSPPPPAPPAPILNRETAFAFLSDHGGPELRGLNLFNCPIPAGRLLPKAPPVPAIAADSTMSPSGPTGSGTPADGAAALPVAPPAAPPTTRPTRVFLYQGCMTMPSGVSLAFLQNTNEKTALYLRAGQTVGGVKVKEFDARRLILTDAAGKDVEILFGTQGEVTSE